MNIILLSGGSGKRLWPLSNEVRSKQFLKIFQNENGEFESMLQRMYRQIKKVDQSANITIATAKTQVSAIHNQLAEDVNICVEPCRRDTFPAIALAALYLKDEKHLPEDEVVLVCPVDPYVDDEYFRALVDLEKLVGKQQANLCLMGMEPTYPSEKYGYILPENDEETSWVRTFKEKPKAADAEMYIKQGALWNGGIFGFKLKYLVDKTRQMLGHDDYKGLLEQYAELPKISFDYAVVEKEPSIQVMRFAGKWKDLGTWNTLTEGMQDAIVGNAILGSGCENVHVLNELDVPVLCMGMKNAVISASPDGILVSDKEESSYIKEYVDQIHQQIMYAEKSWGSFRVIDVEKESLTIKVTLNAGHRMNYHSHQRRDEVWNVISGKGKVIVDGKEKEVKSGMVIFLPQGCKHTVIAETELKIIEVQMGKDIDIADKIKYDMEMSK